MTETKQRRRAWVERYRLGKSISAVADATGLHRRTIRAAENADSDDALTAHQAITLARFYGCSVDYLIGASDERGEFVEPAVPSAAEATT